MVINVAHIIEKYGIRPARWDDLVEGGGSHCVLERAVVVPSYCVALRDVNPCRDEFNVCDGHVMRLRLKVDSSGIEELDQRNVLCRREGCIRKNLYAPVDALIRVQHAYDLRVGDVRVSAELDVVDGKIFVIGELYAHCLFLTNNGRCWEGRGLNQ